MLEGKVNLNLQNDFLINRSTMVKKTTKEPTPEQEKHDQKSKIYWSAAGVAALGATIWGGINYIKKGKGSATLTDDVISTLRKNFSFNFDTSEFLEKFPINKLESPHLVNINNTEYKLTNIIKISDDKILKFNDEKTLFQFQNGDNNILNIKGELPDFSEIYTFNFGNDFNSLTLYSGKNKSMLQFAADKNITFNPNTGEIIETSINNSVAKKILKQFNIEEFINGNSPEKHAKLKENWNRKLEIDEAIGTLANNSCKSKEDIYKLIHTQKFRDLLHNQEKIAESGIDEVEDILWNEFGARLNIARPANGLEDLIRNIISDDAAITGTVNNYVVDGFMHVPKMTNCTHLVEINPSTGSNLNKNGLIYNPDKSYILYETPNSRIVKYTPKSITDKQPEYKEVLTGNGGFTHTKYKNSSELSLIGSDGKSEVKINYNGNLEEPKIQEVHLITHGEKGDVAQMISPEDEHIQYILDNFAEDIYMNGTYNDSIIVEGINNTIKKIIQAYSQNTSN